MMDNNRKTLNKREILMGHAYVFLFFFLTTVACCLAIFMWNSDFRMFEQKEFVKIKMNRIKDFQQEQAESQMPVDSLFRKIEAFQPGVYAQYEEDDIHYLINNLRNTYERNSWDKRYKLFMPYRRFLCHVAVGQETAVEHRTKHTPVQSQSGGVRDRLAEERGRPALGN